MVHIQSDLSGILQAQHPLIFHVSVCLYFVLIALFTFTEQSYSLFQILWKERQVDTELGVGGRV